jgi:hypothetical protein
VKANVHGRGVARSRVGRHAIVRRRRRTRARSPRSRVQPYVRELPSQPTFGDPTSTVSCEVGVGGAVGVSCQRQQRPCITGASRARRLAAFRGIADRRETGWLSQIRQPDDSWSEESGLEAC